MITRIWHGRTSPRNATTYLNFLLTHGTADYRAAHAMSAKVWQKLSKDSCDFWTVTEWESTESIQSFAGVDYQKAKYYPFDNDMLLEFEEHVQHYQSFNVSNVRIRHHIAKLNELYDGDNWVGESFKGKLQDINSAIAFQQPMAGVHSVAELVWHSIYWHRVALHRLQGDKNRYRDETMDKYNFLPLDDLKIIGWDQLCYDLEETRTQLIDFLKDKTDDYLKAEYQPGYSYDFLVEGIIQHDYYHLGQIGLIIKMVRMHKD